MTTITPQDREAAASIAVLPEMRELILSGRADHHAEPFALHRIAAIEQAAKIADRHDTGDCTREDMEARRIAEEIRQLGEEARGGGE